jgi:hypothetical protein
LRRGEAGKGRSGDDDGRVEHCCGWGRGYQCLRGRELAGDRQWWWWWRRRVMGLGSPTEGAMGAIYAHMLPSQSMWDLQRDLMLVCWNG